MLAKRLTLDFFHDAHDNYHIYKINRSEAAELPHNHDFFQVCFVSKGAIIHRSDDREAILIKGDALIVPPEFIHSLISKSSNSEFYSLSFTEELFHPGFYNSGATTFKSMLRQKVNEANHPDLRLKTVLDEKMQNNLMNLMDCLLCEFSSDFPKDLSLAENLVTAILLILARAYYAVPSARRELHNIKDDCYESIMACREYIDRNYMEELSLAQLAKQFALSRSVLCMLFPKIVGRTLKRYHSEKRIEQAISLSKLEHLSFQEISSLVGYEDYSTFFRNFQKIAGISPLQYRIQNFD